MSQQQIDRLVALVVISTALVLVFGSDVVRVLYAIGLVAVSPWIHRQARKTAVINAADAALDDWLTVLLREQYRRQAARHTPTSALMPSDRNEDA